MILHSRKNPLEKASAFIFIDPKATLKMEAVSRMVPLKSVFFMILLIYVLINVCVTSFKICFLVYLRVSSGGRSSILTSFIYVTQSDQGPQNL